MLRRNTLERRLFFWLLAIGLLPPLAILSLALAVGTGWIEWLGTLGPWDRVADSGRDLIEAATLASPADSAVLAAAARHESELSVSLVQASRWTFLGQRIGTLLSIVAILAVIGLATAALLAARSIAVALARPILELVAWSDALAAGQPLPPPASAEARDTAEVHSLRRAMRSAADRIAEARARELEAERLRAWGEMARRVAHEMKNPLTPLRLAAWRIHRAQAGDPALAEAAEVITRETERLDDMARQFAALGRPPEGPATDVDVGELLLGLLDSDLPPHVGRSLVVAPDTPLIRAHYDSLHRAFRNLIRNAAESIEVAGTKGGSLDVRVSRTAGDGVQVDLADDGAGFPPGFAERIFEPDVTLRAGGTGLGLAVVRQAVSAHGGEVFAITREPAGAVFTVRLPGAPPDRAAP